MSCRHRIRPALLRAGAAVLLLGLSLPALAQYVAHPRIYLTPERLERIRTHHWQANSYEWGQLMDTTARGDMDGAKAQALAYAVTGDESYAQTAVGIMLDEMAENPELAVSFNSVGRIFNVWALCYDWLYDSPSFTSAIKQEVIDYVSQVPKDGSGKWNWYPDGTYFNGVSKVIWGPPLWGLATHGDNPLADDYIDNGYTNRWLWIRNSLGYGPANLAVVRGGCMPQGMDYAAGTLSNIVRYLAAVRSATGEDHFDEGPALREYLEYFPKSYYYSEDFIRRPEHGHNAHKRGGYLHNATTALIILMDRYADTPEARWSQWWLNNVEGAYRYPGADGRYFAYLDVIFSDPTIPESSPFAEPLAYFAEGNGMWIARSDWTQGAVEPRTFATFRAGNWTWFNQNHWDQGNYCIYSHGEDLLVDGGLYEGGGGYTVINYHHQTIAHNSILVKDPLQEKGWHFYDWTLPTYENSGGQNRPWRETVPDAVLDGAPKDPSWPRFEGEVLHDMSDVLRRTTNERYTYAFADMTNAYANPRWEQDYDASRLAQVDYRPKVSNVTRHWLYLRERPGDEAEYFVAFDRVSSTDASFRKKSLLHFIGEPEFTNGSLVAAEAPGHIETWDSDRFRMELGGAVLHGAAVLPADARIRKVGGTGYEYWVNGVNYDPYPDTENELGGVWRLEIMPPVERRDDLFLTVLHPDWIGAAAPQVDRVTGSNHEGASFDGWVVLFAKEEAAQSEVTYLVGMDGPQRHLVADMEPGYTYRVYRDGSGAPIAETTAGGDGIVEFESPGGGSYQVSQGDYVPDDTPPTGGVIITGDACVGGSAVTLQLSAADAGAGMGWMRFSNDGSSWSEDHPYQEFWSWELAPGDGERSVYALFGDVLGNWMTDPVSDSVTVDGSPPAATFAIVEDAVADGLVTLDCGAAESGCAGPDVRMSFSNDGSSWSPPEPFAPSRGWDLDAAGEGSYTVYARFGDALDNWTAPLTDTVLLELPSDDTLPPTFDYLTPADGSTGVDPGTSVAFRVQDLGSDVDTESIEFRLDGSPLDYEVSPFSGRFMVIAEPGGLAAETTHSAYARVADLADPPNTAEATWSFTTGTAGVDAQPPASPTGLTAALDEDCGVVLDWEPSGDPDVIAYRVSWGEWPDAAGGELDYQSGIGAVLPDLPEGYYWFGVLAMNGDLLESAVARLPVAFRVQCGSSGDPGDPGTPDDKPEFDALARGEIYPPGVMVDSPDTPLSVANMTAGWTVRIFTVSGRQVYHYTATSNGEDFTWNLLNGAGRRVAKGLYLVRVFDGIGALVSEGHYLRR